MEAPALLLANVDDVECPGQGAGVAGEHQMVLARTQAVFLNEERVVPITTRAQGVWYLDTGASSHMTGVCDAFVNLDETVHGSVRFGDGSLVTICGKGSIMFWCANGNQRVLADVYFIPKLRANIISLGQLDENACKSVIEHDHLCVFDQQRLLLVRVRRTANHL